VAASQVTVLASLLHFTGEILTQKGETVNSAIQTSPDSQTAILLDQHDSANGQLGLRWVGIGIGAALLVTCGLVAALRQVAWEYPVLRVINIAADRSALLDRSMHALTTRDLLQGVVFVSLVWFLWFLREDVDIRARLLTGLAAAASAGVASRLSQIVFPTHLRPLHSPALGFVLPMGVDPNALNHFDSFPSDHGAVFFALAIVIYSVHRRLGVAAFVWAAIVNAARIYDGYHFTSDVIGSIGLGMLTVSLFTNQWSDRLARWLLTFEQRRRAGFYLLAFLATYQIATLFDDVRELSRGFAGVVLHHDPFIGG
jgi:undecaprenyl-diphosphatase